MNEISSLSTLVEKIKRQIYEWEDLVFEKKHGLDLGGAIPRSELVSGDHDAIAHATAYQAVWCRNLREIFAEAMKIGIPLENFIDIGSGKGKACFYASKVMDFQEIIGIDFSAVLIDIANKNCRKFQGDNITFLNVDAREFLLPDATNFVFLFNPFDDVILEDFLQNNLEHFKMKQSLLGYANDIHRQTILRCGFETIFRNDFRNLSLYAFK